MRVLPVEKEREGMYGVPEREREREGEREIKKREREREFVYISICRKRVDVGILKREKLSLCKYQTFFVNFL